MSMTVKDFVENTLKQVKAGLGPDHRGVEVSIAFKAASGNVKGLPGDTVVVAGPADVSFHAVLNDGARFEAPADKAPPE